METIVQDLRYAIRQFVHRPGFTAIAVLSLGLAIGGNSLIYGMVDGFVFHPFPFPDPDRLVAVGVAFPKVSSESTISRRSRRRSTSTSDRAKSFAHVGSFDLGNRNITGGDVPERVFTAVLLDDLFPVIGMAPALGRGFTAERAGAERAAGRDHQSPAVADAVRRRSRHPQPRDPDQRHAARRWWASCRRVCS